MQGLLAAIALLLTLGFGNVTLARPLPPEAAPASQPARVSIYDVFDLTQTEEFDPLISEYSEVWDLDPFLLKGLLFEESRLDPKITNRTSGAAGIAQFTKAGRSGIMRIRRLRDCDEVFSYQDSLDPEKAIPAAAELLSYLVSRWGRNYGIASYNGGPFKHGFSRRVLRRTNRYRTMSGLPPLQSPRPPSPPLPIS